MANYNEASLDFLDATLSQMAPGLSPFVPATASRQLPDMSPAPSQPGDPFILPGGLAAPQMPVHFQLALYNNMQTMQARITQQQAQLEDVQRKLEAHERAEQERNAKPETVPWYRRAAKQLGRTTPEGIALSKLRNLVARVINEALWIRTPLNYDDDSAAVPDVTADESQARLAREAAAARLNERAAWVKLPHPNEVRKDGDSASWPCNLSIKSSAGCNLALKVHVMATVQAGLNDELINKIAIPGCPDITTAAIEHVYNKRFEQLASTYKVQTQATAKIRHEMKQHKARVASTRIQKCNLRLKGITTFKRLHKGLDPTPYVHPDWMSGEESAGEDESLKKVYLDRAGVTEERRQQLKPPKVLATQDLTWRADWHGRLMHRLDECNAAGAPKSTAVHIRVRGGPKIDALPKNRPPPCVVKTSWAEGPSGRSQLADGWEKDAAPSGWQSIRDEVLSWAPRAPQT